MRRLCALLLCLSLVLPLMASAEGSFVMAGYDTESSGHDWVENYFFRRMEERTGVRFTYQQYRDAAEWTQYKAGLTVGGELPDVLFKAQLSLEETLRLYEAGVLLDLKPYIAGHMPNLSALLAAHPEWEEAITLPGGVIPALPQFNSLQNNNAMWINTTFLRNVRLEKPTTAEELLAVLRAFRTQDANRNGREDEVPLEFSGMWDLRWLGHAFGLVANDYYLYEDSGEARSVLKEDANRAFLAWLHTLWEERLMDHNGFTSAETLRQITDSNATMTYGIVMGPSASLMIATSAAEEYEVLQPLTYEGKQRYRSLLGTVYPGTFALTTACADPARLLEWVDYLYSEEGCFLAYTGLEGKEWERNSDGTWYWLDDMETVSNSVLPDSTIGEGTPIPGYVPTSYQLTFDNEQVHKSVEALSALGEVAVVPFPDVALTQEERQRVGAIWAELGPWAETRMTWFVTGDQPLNDETWAAFCDGVDQRGLTELTSIFQSALNRR